MQIAAKIRRDVKLFERQWPWLLLTFVTGTSLTALVALATLGAFEELDPVVWGRNVRGYTAIGVSLGVFAVFLSGLTFFYSLRKRVLQERLPFLRGTMMSWLSLHVWLGMLAVACVILHAGFGLVSSSFTSGKVLFVVFILLALTGIVWRLVYKFVPPSAAPQIGNYSQLGSAKRAEAQTTEIEKIAAGKSPELHRVKEWLLAAERHPAEVERAAASVPPAERADLIEIARLCESRSRALKRRELQGKYTRRLQGWRVLHVPLTFAFGALLVVHVIGAFDLHARWLPVGAVKQGPLSGFESSEECSTCHSAIYAQWRTSMHAHALTSPITIAQTNQDARVTLVSAADPDPTQICVNSHAPIAAAITGAETLPIAGGPAMNEGISCGACHQYAGADPPPGSAGHTRWQADLARGHRYFGPIDDPVGNAFHSSEDNATFKQPDKLCNGCHDVNLDLNGDGKIHRGEDLVLQTTHDEFEEYVAAGGRESCVSCHMPIAKMDRAADGARLVIDQDFEAPARRVRDHSFVGVDYPLDEVPKNDPNKAKREGLLRSAATLKISTPPAIASDGIAFAVSVTNTGAGHYIPTGFAFSRQMWLEVKVTDRAGATLLASGVLAKTSDDLCDAASLGETSNPMTAQNKGCDKADPALVNFQQKLLDHVELARDKQGATIKQNDRGDMKLAQPANGKETWLQHTTGGVVARVRPSDGQTLSPLPPGVTRTFVYKLPTPPRFAGELSISVRLLFRNLPPAMIRTLAANQAPDDQPKLGPLVANLQIVEMATQREKFLLKGN
jgi:hypothetical protein